MFIAELFLPEHGNNLDAPQTKNGLKKKVVYLHNGWSSNSAVKNNDIFKFPGKWIEVEKTILSEVTQIQKEKYSVYSFISEYHT